MTTHHLIVKGRVQGVGFRFFTYHLAKEYGIKGWVRNLYNGDVEVFAQGDLKQVEIFKKKLKDGATMGRVVGIEENILDHKECSDFDIKY